MLNKCMTIIFLWVFKNKNLSRRRATVSYRRVLSRPPSADLTVTTGKPWSWERQWRWQLRALGSGQTTSFQFLFCLFIAWTRHLSSSKCIKWGDSIANYWLLGQKDIIRRIVARWPWHPPVPQYRGHGVCEDHVRGCWDPQGRLGMRRRRGPAAALALEDLEWTAASAALWINPLRRRGTREGAGQPGASWLAVHSA